MAADQLEDFGAHWAKGTPALIEQSLLEFKQELNRLLANQDEADHQVELRSRQVQVLSQLALVYAIQKRFDEAESALDRAGCIALPESSIAHARWLLEKGRVLHQRGDIAIAIGEFEGAYAAAIEANCESLMIDAAHMRAIVSQSSEEKIRWNEIAYNAAKESDDAKCRAWLGSLANNLGQFLHEAGRFEESLDAYEQALQYRIEEGYFPNILVARWGVARALRCVGKLDRSLQLLDQLVLEYFVEKSDEESYRVIEGVPPEVVPYMRGLVFEELAEVYRAKSLCFAELAFRDLSSTAELFNIEPQRIARLASWIGDSSIRSSNEKE